MKLTYENIKQATEDMMEWKRYLKIMETSHPHIIRKSFKQMFGYSVVLFEDNTFELRGERFK